VSITRTGKSFVSYCAKGTVTPYACGKNKQIQIVMKQCKNNPQNFIQKILNSLKNPSSEHGAENNIFEFEGFKNLLLRVPKFYDDPALALKNSKKIFSFKENVNHIIAKIGNVEILQKIPGINKKNSEFTEIFESLPQKSFNEHIKNIQNNMKKGFWHDPVGANILVDKNSKKITIIDSFSNEREASVLCPLQSVFWETIFTPNPSIKALKKALKGFTTNMNVTYEKDGLEAISAQLKNSSKFKELFEQVDEIKQQLSGKNIAQIKQDPLWPSLKIKLRELHKEINKLEFIS